MTIADAVLALWLFAVSMYVMLLKRTPGPIGHQGPKGDTGERGLKGDVGPRGVDAPGAPPR